MITRKIGKLLRGDATPAQMMLACVLGAILGFVPGFGQAPGLMVILILALVIFNANLPLAAVAGAVAELVSLILLPVSFALGRVLLDGPTQPLFKTMINAPVLALCGFEYYVTAGGLVLGIVLGIVLALIVIKTIQGFRSTIGKLEEGSEQYKRWMGRWWAKLLVFVFFGSGSKQSYAELRERSGGLIRPVGVVFAVLVVVLLVVVQMFFAGPVVASVLRQGLEKANGATVDLAGAEVDLANGKMVLNGLAMADPNALDTDLFRAEKIEADISATSLLRKQLKLDRIVVVNAQNGTERDTPGKLVGRAPKPAPAAKPQEGEQTLDAYIQNPKEWLDRLAQVRRWLERVSGPSAGPEAVEAAEVTEETESLSERLKREAQALGYARVAAHHLIVGAPQLTIGELVAEKVQTTALEGETLDILANNISTQPFLLNGTPTLKIESSGQTLHVSLALGAVSAGGGDNAVRFAYRGLPVDRIADSLDVSGTKPISGGTMDVTLEGTIRTRGGAYIDMPLQVTLHNTTIAISGAGSAPVDELTIPLGLRGPIDNPRIRIDDSKLADALVAAGAGVLANKVRGRADELIKDATSDLKLKEGLPEIDLGKGIPGFGDKGNEKKTEKKDEKKKDDLRDAADNLTKSLFGGKKKEKKKP